ncbi:hypothetical protein [Burkholderia pseudomallei]|uniref:hypothetical protein n=1 Tax=Burkholderia pseudomallei TaxID=28450 RepID=UPI000A1A313E|nr:hypothetical protein [Burkholderia pseudomallei]ARL91033.1 hypothetical protein BOC57_35250 [Burkholderia pseudomallei]
MDNTTVAGVGGIATAVIGAFSWLIRRAISQADKKFEAHDQKFEAQERQMKEQEKAFDAYRLHVAETYTPNSAFEKAIDRFSASVDAVFKKLEAMDEKFDRRLENKADRQ